MAGRKERPLPPPPKPDRGCVFGGSGSTGWRWFAAAGSWERVCDIHHTPVAQRRGDYVSDTQITDRQDP